MKKTSVFASVAVVISLSACSEYNDKRGLGDAPIGGRDDSAWDIIQAPDKFGNIATKCNPFDPGTRLYIVTHSKTDVQPVIVVDEGCNP